MIVKRHAASELAPLRVETHSHPPLIGGVGQTRLSARVSSHLFAKKGMKS